MMTAKERNEAAKANAMIEDWKSMKELFNAMANHVYLENTSKTFEELNSYLSYEQSSWADGLIGNEWETVEACIGCAEEAASQALEAEVE
jgi:hypothetical protein